MSFLAIRWGNKSILGGGFHLTLFFWCCIIIRLFLETDDMSPERSTPMSRGQVSSNGREHVRPWAQSFSPLKNRPPSQGGNTKIEVHPDILMKTNGLLQKHESPHLPRAGCECAKKNFGGSHDIYENKGRKSDKLEGPTMLMKTKGVTNYSCQCVRGSGRSSDDKPLRRT